MISLVHVVCVSACLIVLFLFLDLTQLKECKWSFFSLISETLVISLPPGWLLQGVFLPSLLTRVFLFPDFPSVVVSRNSQDQQEQNHTHLYGYTTMNTLVLNRQTFYSCH